MLAQKVEQDFIAFIRSDTLSMRAPQHFIDRAKKLKSQDKKTLFSSEQTGHWRTDLPQKFSDLQDDHFPLFVTFDDVSGVIMHMIYRLLIAREAMQNAPQRLFRPRE
jgi:hypothetical protein